MPATRPRSGQFQMADAVLNGHLAERIQELVDAGHSWEEAAKRLYAEGVHVSSPTLRRWAALLGIEADTAKAG